eukprot:6859620-Pyramimonas_sp.AAC.1
MFGGAAGRWAAVRHSREAPGVRDVELHAQPVPRCRRWGPSEGAPGRALARRGSVGCGPEEVQDHPGPVAAMAH